MDDVWTKRKCTVINFKLKMNENYHVDEHVTRVWRKKNNPTVLIGFTPLNFYRLSAEKLSWDRDSRVSFSELLYEKKVDLFD